MIFISKILSFSDNAAQIMCGTVYSTLLRLSTIFTFLILNPIAKFTIKANANVSKAAKTNDAGKISLPNIILSTSTVRIINLVRKTPRTSPERIPPRVSTIFSL